MLTELHWIIQLSMGWEYSHLWEFEKAGMRYGDLQYAEEDIFDVHPMQDADQARLCDILRTPKSKLNYQYDFGDCWDHEIVLEKRFPPEPDVFYPRCIKGKMACPPEDCGGLPGYYNNLDILDDPQSEEFEDVQDWMGKNFDPEKFDLEKVNGLLKKRFK